MKATQQTVELPIVELKPCPFCGSDDVTFVHDGHDFVSCNACWADGPSTDESSDDPEQAAARWNTRPEDNLIKEAVEALTDGRDTLALLNRRFDSDFGQRSKECDKTIAHLDATLTKLTGEKQ
jgi:Lar family restriction alleviation protein